ncbi:hypothetical protein [Streptomyces sp. NPDC005078]|uniref:hypothetical protein n=1 Tax=unclassified Streptomyces TaxID=2593676 RepID=UPI0033A3C863
MSAPIVIHGLAPSSGRAVTINNEIVGVVYDDQGLVELLRQAGVYDAENCLDDPRWVEWRDGRAHLYAAV